MCFTYSYFWDSSLGHAEVPLPKSNTETLMQHPAEVEG